MTDSSAFHHPTPFRQEAPEYKQYKYGENSKLAIKLE